MNRMGRWEQWEQRVNERADARLARKCANFEVPHAKLPEDRLTTKVRARLAARREARPQRPGRSR